MNQGDSQYGHWILVPCRVSRRWPSVPKYIELSTLCFPGEKNFLLSNFQHPKPIGILLWNEEGNTGFYEASPEGNPEGRPSRGISRGAVGPEGNPEG